jgi:hypothetical protein
MSIYVIAHTATLPTVFKTKMVSQFKNTSFKGGFVLADKSSANMPKRSDLKIMREDIAVSIIDIKTELERFDLPNSEISKMGLFMANGAFLDNPESHLNRMPEIFKLFTKEMPEEEKKKLIFKKTPPLLALETLTNASMSFIAQYIGINGQNTTFGNTSISGTYALQQSVMELNKSDNNLVVCGGANCGDTYSYLSNSPLLKNNTGWFESAAVGNLILSSNEVDKAKALCKISAININSKLPSFENQEIERDWKVILPKTKSDLLIFSGAFTPMDYELDKAYCDQLNDTIFSYYDECGNLGAANISLGISKGINSFSKTIKTVDIIDRDIYGRESLIRIEQC